MRSEKISQVRWRREEMKVTNKARYICDDSRLMAEWNHEKNTAISPYDITTGSGKKVWWKCALGHEWEETPNRRSSKNGCPFCSNHRVLVGYNDLATVIPILAKEWHPTKNGSLSPQNVTKGSNRKVWWLCNNGHEFEATVSNRSNGKGCPYCSSRRVDIGRNDLFSKFPDIAKEWHPTKNGSLTPDQISFGSIKKVWWTCSCGHEYVSTPNNRTSNNKGCPYCSGRKVLSGINDLKTLFPHVADEWCYEKNAPVTPDMVFSHSSKEFWWTCSVCSTDYISSIAGRTRGSGCPRCAVRHHSSFAEQAIYFYVSQVYPDSINRYTELFSKMELDIFIPSLKIGIEYDGSIWHESEDSFLREQKKYQMCQAAGIKLIRVREKTSANDTLICDCVVESEPYRKELSKLDKVIGNLFQIVQVDVDVDVIRDELEIKSFYYSNLGKLSIAETMPHLTKEWDYEKNGNLLPTMVSAGAADIVWWKCAKGHSWKTQVYNRSKGVGCPYCAGKKAILNETDLETTHPALIKEWDYEKNEPLLPHMFSQGSSTSVWWKCSKGHSWKTQISHRAIKRTGCPFCSNNFVLEGYNDLQTLHPQLASEWNYKKNGELYPNSIVAGSTRKVWWVCQRGHEWEAQIRARVRGNGCPYCSKRKPIPGVNDLATVDPQLAEDWHPTKNDVLLPKDVTASTSRKVWWHCRNCGFDWEDRIDRRHRGKGCPECEQR